MDEKYIIYVRADEAGRIVEINSSAFLADTAGWTAIDEGYSDKYHHAQGNYFALPLYGPDGCANYKLADGTPALRTEAEKAAAELAAAKAEAAEWKDKFMRLHAEWDTYRRRTNEQREAEKARAAEKLVTSLLPVIDDFERTIDYAEKNGEGELLGGVRAVHSKFVGVLEKDGVEVIDPTGEAFDALEAQAVATVPDTEAFDETVHEVYQKGYRLGAKVIRPAMVTVTTGGPKRPKPEEDETEE